MYCVVPNQLPKRLGKTSSCSKGDDTKPLPGILGTFLSVYLLKGLCLQRQDPNKYLERALVLVRIAPDLDVCVIADQLLQRVVVVKIHSSRATVQRNRGLDNLKREAYSDVKLPKLWPESRGSLNLQKYRTVKSRANICFLSPPNYPNRYISRSNSQDNEI